MTQAVARLVRVQSRFPALQLAALAALCVYGTATINGFSSESSLRAMFVLAALLGLAAVGQTLVIMIGGLDLSVPAFIVMGAILISQLYGAHHWPFIAALALIVAIAAVGGAFSGWLCHRYAINPLIVTLGMGSIAVGGAVAWTNAKITGSAPTFLSDLVAVNGHTAGIPIPPICVIWVAVTAAVAVFLHRSAPGRRMLATGANPRAAALSLVRTRLVWASVFAASAIGSALVGVLLAGFSGADQSLGDPYLFQGLTAIAIGGVAVAGARGDYTNTAIGALILTALTTILVGRGYDSADQQIIFGLLILIVVAGYGRERRLRDRV